MAVADSRRPPVRASDAERDLAVRHLCEAVAAGCIDHDSFVRRLDLALQAMHGGALDEVTSDLPPRRRTDVVWALSGRIMDRVQRLLTSHRAPRRTMLRLPQEPADYSIGRGATCDVVVPDPTVSRVHASLRSFGGQWFLADLGSTNGTRVNGLRVRRSVPVVPGDVVTLGAAALRIEPPVVSARWTRAWSWRRGSGWARTETAR